MKAPLIAAFSAWSIWAQVPAPPAAPAPPAGPAHPATPATPPSPAQAVTQALRLVTAINNGPVIKGAPYSADAVTESIQLLSDGNRIVQRSTQKLFRDSEGRERRESEGVVMITDPVAKTSYTLHPDTKTATKTSSYGGASEFFFAGTTQLHAASQGVTNGTFYSTRLNGRPIPTINAGNEPIEVLGLRSMEGVQASGTRTVSTIAAGTIGNEKPIEIINEQWMSPELQVPVMTRYSDPRTGENTYKLTNIQRANPPRSLFEVPSDYRTTTTGNVTLVRPKQE